jgi:hypothetical protein
LEGVGADSITYGQHSWQRTNQLFTYAAMIIAIGVAQIVARKIMLVQLASFKRVS